MWGNTSGKRKQNHEYDIYPAKRRRQEELTGNTNTQRRGTPEKPTNTVWSSRCIQIYSRETLSSPRATTYDNETMSMSAYSENHQIDRTRTTNGYNPSDFSSSDRYPGRKRNSSRNGVQYNKQFHRGDSSNSNQKISEQCKGKKRSHKGGNDDYQASKKGKELKRRKGSYMKATKNCYTDTYRVNDFRNHGFLESKDILLKRFERIKNIKDFQDGEFEDFKFLLGSAESFSNENLWCLMKILSHLLQESNTELCEKLIENDVFNRKELMAYVTELLCRELSGPDIIFLRNSSEVLTALSLETTIDGRKVKTFLSLIISLTEKLEKNAMLSKKSISSISLKEIKGRLESGKKGETIFSDSPREESSQKLISWKN